MKKNGKSKRVISVLLAILMIVTGIPSSFIAAHASEPEWKAVFELSEVAVTRLLFDSNSMQYYEGGTIENGAILNMNSPASIFFTVTQNAPLDGVIRVLSSQDQTDWKEVESTYCSNDFPEAYIINYVGDGTLYIRVYVDYRAIQLVTPAYSGAPCQILSVEFQGLTNSENAKYDEAGQKLLYKEIVPTKVTVRTSAQDATVRLTTSKKNGQEYVDDYSPRRKSGDDFEFTLTPDDKDIEAYNFIEDADSILYSINADEHITTYYRDNEHNSLSTDWIRASYCKKESDRVGALMAVADKGYTLKSASAKTYSGVGLLARAYGFAESYTIKNYDFAAKDGGSILEGGTVTLESAPVANYTATVTYPSDKAEIQLAVQWDGGLSGPRTLDADGKVTVSNTERLILRIRPSDSTAYSVFSTASDGKKKISGDRIINDSGVWEEYCLDRMFEDFSVEITAKAKPVVSLKPEHVTFVPVQYQPDMNGNQKYQPISGTINRDNKITLNDDTPFYFCVDSRCHVGTVEIGTLTGEGDNAVFQPLTPMPDTDPKVVGEENAVYMVQPGYDEEIVVTDRSTPLTVPIRRWNEGAVIRETVINSNGFFAGDYIKVSDDKSSVDIWEHACLEMHIEANSPEDVEVFAYRVVGKDGEGKEILGRQDWGHEPNSTVFSFNVDENTREIWYGTRSRVIFDAPDQTRLMLKNYGDGTERPISNHCEETTYVGFPVVFTVYFPNDGKSYYVTTTEDESGKLTGEKQGDGGWLYSVDIKSNTTISVKEKPSPYELLLDNKSENVTCAIQLNNKITKSETDNNVYFGLIISLCEMTNRFKAA